jgi:hypothetical protein
MPPHHTQEPGRREREHPIHHISGEAQGRNLVINADGAYQWGDNAKRNRES